MQLAFLRAEVFCFRDPLYHDFYREVATEILILTMRAKIGKVEAEEWKELIGEEIRLATRCSEREARYIATRALEENVCIDASEEVGLALAKLGYKVERVELEKSRKPLDILREKLRREILFGEKVPEESVERLVMEHLKFVELIIGEDFEEAYREWAAHS
ncbi:MAG: hypothetical protein QME59_02150 [Candidatus Hydrothermarchaeota archaeon]|nr:hypothetical protein [Candidatus Hydrothermarchaeota archaeon]